MTENYRLFDEEEILKSRKLGKPLPQNNEFAKTKSLFPISKSSSKNVKNILEQGKNISSKNGEDVSLSNPNSQKNYSSKKNFTGNYSSDNYKKLVINLNKVKRAPKDQLRQFKQLRYFSRIEKKENGTDEEKEKNKDTFLYDHNDKIISSREDMNKIAKEWTEHKHRKNGEAISRHLTLSVGGKEDKEKVMFATRQFLKEAFAQKGYEYCYAPHYDTKNDHIHLVVRKRNNQGKNLRIVKEDLDILRQKYNKYLSMAGIKRDISSRLDNKRTLEHIKKGKEDLDNQKSWYQNKLGKGQEEEFNAYNYKKTLASKIEEQVNIIKINDYLSQLKVEDKTIINVIKPLLKKKGIKIVEEALISVKQAQKKGDIKDLKGLILTSIRNEYKPSNKKGQSLKITINTKEDIKNIKRIKNDIVSKDNKKDILLTLNKSLDKLKEDKDKLLPTMEAIFNDRNIRYSYVEKKEPIKDLDKIIDNRIDKQYKPKKQIYYRPELTDYEIQEKFADFIRQETNISPVGLETAIANAFANPSQKIRFGHKKQNEVKWHGEAGYIKSYKTGEHEPWGINKIKQDGSIKFKEISKEEVRAKMKRQEEDKKRLELETKEKHEKFANKSQNLFNKFSTIPTKENPYLRNKQVDDISLHNVRYKESGDLAIPLQDVDNKVWNFQTINGEGKKEFEYGAKKRGNFFIISQEKNKQLDNGDKPILLAEGLATGLTVHRASNYLDTVVFFDAGNLTSVVTNIKEKYPEKKIIVMADDDLKAEVKMEEEGKKGINAGLINAYKAQEKYPDITILKPSLTREEKIEQKLSDFNDLEKVRGKEFIKNEILDKIKGLKEDKSRKMKF